MKNGLGGEVRVKKIWLIPFLLSFFGSSLAFYLGLPPRPRETAFAIFLLLLAYLMFFVFYNAKYTGMSKIILWAAFAASLFLCLFIAFGGYHFSGQTNALDLVFSLSAMLLAISGLARIRQKN